MRYFPILLIALSSFVFLPRSVFGQGFGGEIGYVLAQNKEAFAGRLYVGTSPGYFRFGIGYERGEFNSMPTGRVLPYYSLKGGIDFCLVWGDEGAWFSPYIGGDFEYLKTTRVVEESRVSIIPKAGIRFLHILFAEASADNLNEPGSEKRFFDVTMNAWRLTVGLSIYLSRS